MTDLEMTKLCAEALGWKHLGAVGILPNEGESKDEYARRGDALGKYWCYSGQNDWWLNPEGQRVCGPCQMSYDPLHDDAQAMALVKKCRLDIETPECFGEEWEVVPHDGLGNYPASIHNDLNRAIVECVAKMQKANSA